MNPFFKNINIFSCQKSIFSKKNFENWTYFTRISEFFRKVIYNIWIFLEGPNKSREIPDEFYYIVDKFIKKLENGLDREGLLEIGWKFGYAPILRAMLQFWGLCSHFPRGGAKLYFQTNILRFENIINMPLSKPDISKKSSALNNLHTSKQSAS